jgi:transmembrane sensor
VLGTSFNVRAYEKEPETEVFVVTGTVALSRRDLSKQILLTPGNTGLLTGGDLYISNAVENALAWRDKKLEFRQTPLSRVVKIMRSYFQVEISLKNPRLENCRFTGSFANPTLEEVVETLQLALDLQIDKVQSQYIFDGPPCE